MRLKQLLTDDFILGEVQPSCIQITLNFIDAHVHVHACVHSFKGYAGAPTQ